MIQTRSCLGLQFQTISNKQQTANTTSHTSHTKSFKNALKKASHFLYKKCKPFGCILKNQNFSEWLAFRSGSACAKSALPILLPVVYGRLCLQSLIRDRRPPAFYSFFSSLFQSNQTPIIPILFLSLFAICCKTDTTQCVRCRIHKHTTTCDYLDIVSKSNKPSNTKQKQTHIACVE